MATDLLIVTDALLKERDGVRCHPALLPWQEKFAGRRRQWFSCSNKNPLSWYAAILDVPPSQLLAGCTTAIAPEARQCWVASPYHAQLMRDAVRVLPEGQLLWSAEDAGRIAAVLNPLLAEEHMQLLAIGAALLLTCRDPLDAWPVGFGAISGDQLPNSPIEGEDGGRLDRLLSEFQMLLFQHPSIERHARNEPDINGIWLWGGSSLPQTAAHRPLPVATRNPFLQSVVDGRHAKLMISEAALLDQLLQPGAAMPANLLLAGDNRAVLLTKSWWPSFGKAAWGDDAWLPDLEQDEMMLFNHIAGLLKG